MPATTATTVSFNSFLRETAKQIMSKNEYEKLFSSWEYSVFAPAYRLVRYFSPNFNSFLAQIQKHLNKYTITKFTKPITIPLMILSTKPNEYDIVYAFRNLELKINYFGSTLTSNANFLYTDQLFDSKVLKLQEIEKFKYSQLEVRKRIKRYQRMTIHEAVNIIIQTLIKNEPMFANANGGTLSRDIADLIVQSRKPMELIFCKTPEEYERMYASPGPDSCMKNGEKRTWDSLTKQYRYWHPSWWYMYCPYTQGVFAYSQQKKDTVAHRTIVYDLPEGKYFGRIYTCFAGQQDAFKNSLRQMGYKELNEHDPKHSVFLPECVFEIPGVLDRNKNEHICPLPYMDNIRNSIQCYFRNNIFVMQIHGSISQNKEFKGPLLGTQNQHGILHEHEVGYRECISCKQILSHGEPNCYQLFERPKEYIHYNCIKATNSAFVYLETSSACQVLLRDQIKKYENYLLRLWMGEREANLNEDIEEKNSTFATSYRAACARTEAFILVNSIEELHELILSNLDCLKIPSKFKVVRRYDYVCRYGWANMAISSGIYKFLRDKCCFRSGTHEIAPSQWKAAYEKYKNPPKEKEIKKENISTVSSNANWVTFNQIDDLQEMLDDVE